MPSCRPPDRTALTSSPAPTAPAVSNSLARQDSLTFFARDPAGLLARIRGDRQGSERGHDRFAGYEPSLGAHHRSGWPPGRGLAHRSRMDPPAGRQLSGRFHIQARTDAQGNYRISGLVPGSRCELSVYLREDARRVRKWSQADADFPGRGSWIDDAAGLRHRDQKPPGSASRKKQRARQLARPPTIPSGPTRSEISDLIRAIGRDPVSAQLVDRIVAMYHPRFLWSRDFGRMKQVATDPNAVQHLDRLSQEVQGKPLDTLTLLRGCHELPSRI